MIGLRGLTFVIHEELMQMNGRWRSDLNAWVFADKFRSKLEQIAALRPSEFEVIEIIEKNPHRMMQPEYEYEDQGIKFSHKGHGATPYIQEIEYFGFSIRMRPSMFLKLTLLGKDGQQESFSDEELKWVRTAMKSGSPIAVPFLKFSRNEYNRGPDWRCAGHEGRHRMSVLMREHNDEPIPIAVMIRDGGETRARNVTKEAIATLNKGAWSEWFEGALPKFIEGPLFVGNAYVQGSPVVVSNPSKAEYTAISSREAALGFWYRTDGCPKYENPCRVKWENWKKLIHGKTKNWFINFRADLFAKRYDSLIIHGSDKYPDMICILNKPTINRNPKVLPIEKLHKLLNESRHILDSNEFDRLDEFAGNRTGEFLKLVGRIVGRPINDEDAEWEALVTMTGSHEFRRPGIFVTIQPNVIVEVE